MNRYLFVIDYQNDFVDGALGFPGAEKLDEKIAAKVRRYGKGHVFFTRDKLSGNPGGPEPSCGPLHPGHQGLGGLR